LLRPVAFARALRAAGFHVEEQDTFVQRGSVLGATLPQ
jgi:hypothetical protein